MTVRPKIWSRNVKKKLGRLVGMTFSGNRPEIIVVFEKKAEELRPI